MSTTHKCKRFYCLQNCITCGKELCIWATDEDDPKHPILIGENEYVCKACDERHASL